MSTKLSVYLGIGKHNKGTIHAFSNEVSKREEVGSISGTEGFETVKLCNSIVELGELPDIEALIAKRHTELLEAENERHRNRITELQQIQAA